MLTFLLRQDLQFIDSRGSIVARRGVRRSMLTVGRDIAHGQQSHGEKRRWKQVEQKEMRNAEKIQSRRSLARLTFPDTSQHQPWPNFSSEAGQLLFSLVSPRTNPGDPGPSSFTTGAILHPAEFPALKQAEMKGAVPHYGFLPRFLPRWILF